MKVHNMMATLARNALVARAYHPLHSAPGQRRLGIAYMSMFPQDFLRSVDTLNQRDRELEIADYKASLKAKIPQEHHATVANLSCYDALFDIYFTFMMYNVPVTPNQKVHVRKTIQHLLQKKGVTWSDQEMSFFRFVLEHYDCLA